MFPVTLDFPFSFFGTVYSAANVSTNGNIQFAPSNNAQFTNQPIPTAGGPNNMVAALWDDFNFNTNAVDDGLYTQTLGMPGVDLRQIFQWTNVSHFGLAAPGDRNTFQLVIFENGNMEFRYGSVEGLTATIGVENIDGTSGTSIDPATIGAGNTSRAVAFVDGPGSCDNVCRPDVDGNGVLNPDDLSDYINCFFSQPPCNFADYDRDGIVNPDDLSTYITEFFAGCL